MKYIYTFFFLIFIISCSDATKTMVTPKDYLDEVFKIVEKHSIRRDSVDFNKIKSEAYARLKNAYSIETCYPIVKIILIDLVDRHSSFMTKEQVEKWQTPSNINEVITFSAKLVDQNVGYIRMKGFGKIDSLSIRQYADSLQNLIKSIDNAKLKGWVLDIRENNGGNCWPMLAGLGPLLGDGVCGYFISNDHRRSSWFYQNGKSGIDSVAIVSVSTKPYTLINKLNPIAVLTGNHTASSGEVVATAFRKKNNFRSFGESTCGLSTGNTPYKLSDGSMLILTSSIYADRQGNVLGGKIEPDVIIKTFDKSNSQSNDLVLQRAVNWIYEK